jgi:hypothetical protein
MRKTLENGATPSEEASAIQLAHMLVRQHDLDLDVFRACLSMIGEPPRYLLTPDGFLVPTHLLQSAEPHLDPSRGHNYGYGLGSHGIGHGHGPANHPRRRRTDNQQATGSAGDYCPISPTGRHRMERYMRGTRSTGAMYCLHCGYRTE